MSTVRRYLNELEEAGLIEIERRGARRVNKVILKGFNEVEALCAQARDRSLTSAHDAGDRSPVNATSAHQRALCIEEDEEVDTRSRKETPNLSSPVLATPSREGVSEVLEADGSLYAQDTDEKGRPVTFLPSASQRYVDQLLAGESVDLPDDLVEAVQQKLAELGHVVAESW